MAAKKKAKKTTTRSTTTDRKVTGLKKTAMKRQTPKKSVKKTAQKKLVAKRKVIGKTSAAKTRNASGKQVREKSETLGSAFSGVRGARALPGGQSGDLQGLSNLERADSESVDELLEEGNAFEADAVAGVENAGDAEEREVRTHEVPEDDVPDEYLDKE
jgi:N utilization substance protein A